MAVRKEVTVEALEKAKKALLAAPPKIPQKKLLLDALLELKPTIVGMEGKGYSRAEICELLDKQGVPAKEYHLKALLTKKRQEVPKN